MNGERNYQIPTTQRTWHLLKSISRRANLWVFWESNTPNKTIYWNRETDRARKSRCCQGARVWSTFSSHWITWIATQESRKYPDPSSALSNGVPIFEWARRRAISGHSRRCRWYTYCCHCNYIAGKEIVKSEVVSDQVTTEPISNCVGRTLAESNLSRKKLQCKKFLSWPTTVQSQIQRQCMKFENWQNMEPVLRQQRSKKFLSWPTTVQLPKQHRSKKFLS